MRLAGPMPAIFTAATLVAAQTGAYAQAVPPPEGLHIVIIKGDKFTNNIKKRVNSEPTVEVRDRNNSPVPGAIVTFTLPQTGAGGNFAANGAKIITMTTGENGRATAAFQPSGQGSFKLNISASHQGQTASTAVTQANAALFVGSMTATTFAVVATTVAAATAAGVAAAVVTSGGGKSAKVGVNGIPTVTAP